MTIYKNPPINLDAEIILQANNELQGYVEIPVISAGAGSKIDYNLPVVTYIDHIGVIYEVNTKDWTHNPAPIDYSNAEVPLTFQEWNQYLTLENIDRTLDYVIGATYIPADGKSWFKINITKTSGSDPIDALRQIIYYTLTDIGNTYIDWGDGSTVDVITKTTAAQEYKNTSHTYSDYGVYWISMWRDSGTYSFGNRSSSRSFLGGVEKKQAILIETIIGKDVISIGEDSFYTYKNVNCIVIPNNVTKLGRESLNTCRSLKTLILPKYIEGIDPGSIRLIYPLYLSCPNNNFAHANINAVSNKFIYYYKNKRIIDMLYFPNLNRVNKSIIFNDNVINIIRWQFDSPDTTLYDFSQNKQVPTLEDINAFRGINSIAIIKVPDNLYDEWIVTTNWSTFYNYIMRASEYDKLYNN